MIALRCAPAWAATEIGGSSGIFESAPPATPPPLFAGFGFGFGSPMGGGVLPAIPSPLPATAVFGRLLKRLGAVIAPFPESVSCASVTFSATGGGWRASIATSVIALGKNGCFVLVASSSYSFCFL